MLIPVGPVNNKSITLLRVTNDLPEVLSGALTHFDGTLYELALGDTDPPLVVGEQVLIDLGVGGTGRRRSLVVEVNDGSITVEPIGRPGRRERREFPRIEGLIALKFQILESDQLEKLESWLRPPHLMEAGGTWLQPDPFMEFSATGLNFSTTEYIAPDSLFRMKMKLTFLGDKEIMCGGQVVRCDLTDEGTFACAVALIGLSSDIREALMDYTRHCQDIVLGLDTIHNE